MPIWDPSRICVMIFEQGSMFALLLPQTHICLITQVNTLEKYQMSFSWGSPIRSEYKKPHSLSPCGTRHISQQHCRLWWCLQTCDIWVTVSSVLRIALQSSSLQREPGEDHLLFWTGGWAELSIVFFNLHFRALGKGLTVFKRRLLNICPFT